VPRRTLLVWLGLATIYLVWGSTYLAIRVMVETVPPLLGAGLRFLFAGAVFAAWIVGRGGFAPLRVGRRELAAAAAVGVLLMAGGNGLVTVAEQDAPSGLAALIIAAIPLCVIVLRLLWRERVPRVTLAGVAVGFAGVALLVVPADRPEGAALWSVLVLLLAAASWATGSFLSGRLALPSDVIVAAALQMLIGGGLLIVAGLVAGEALELDVSALSGRSVGAFVYLVVAGSLLAFTAYVWLLQNVPISTVATYAFVNPVVAVFLGWAILDEEVTRSVVVGALVIVVSVAFVVLKETTAPQAPITSPEVAEAFEAESALAPDGDLLESRGSQRSHPEAVDPGSQQGGGAGVLKR
jgi:drug/metabolite transporter (DMT)-like permease